jgi:hypothetical protein
MVSLALIGGVGGRGQFEIVADVCGSGSRLFDPSQSGGDKRDCRWCVAIDFVSAAPNL